MLTLFVLFKRMAAVSLAMWVKATLHVHARYAGVAKKNGHARVLMSSNKFQVDDGSNSGAAASPLLQ